MRTFILNLLLALLALVPLQAQKYLSQSSQNIKTTYGDHTVFGSKTLAENLISIPELATYGEYVSTYEENSMDADFMGTFFVITNPGLEVDDNTRIIQLLATDKGRRTLIESLTVPGRMGAHELRKAATDRGGSFSLRSVGGSTIEVIAGDGIIELIDARGRRAQVVATDLFHKNGIFHVVSGFVFPADKGSD